jgi:hypothetical protein
MKKTIEKAKKKFLKMVENFGSDPYCLLSHVPEAEKWAKFMLKNTRKPTKMLFCFLFGCMI